MTEKRLTSAQIKKGLADMPLIDVNETQLFVEEFGEGDEAILCLHALFFDGRMYANQIDVLSKHFRCITLDWRGQGRSAKPIGGYDVDNLCHDILGVMVHFGLARCHILGMSVGGVCGIRLAALYPEKVGKLAVGGASAESEPIEKVVKYERLLLEEFAVDTAGPVDALMTILYGAPFLNNPDNEDRIASERARIMDNDGAAVARASAPILRRVDIRHMLPHVQSKTLVFVGELDGANPPEKARTIAGGITSAQLDIMPGIGHQPNVEAAEELSLKLLRFFSS
ncbi:MAG: alpha/beta fold hydrolase [Sphingomonadales bacterium]